jgi:hypothetical protein
LLGLQRLVRVQLLGPSKSKGKWQLVNSGVPFKLRNVHKLIAHLSCFLRGNALGIRDSPRFQEANEKVLRKSIADTRGKTRRCRGICIPLLTQWYQITAITRSNSPFTKDLAWNQDPLQRHEVMHVPKMPDQEKAVEVDLWR